MKNRYKHSVNYIGVLTALTSLIIGIIALVMLKTSGDTGFVGIGYFLTLSVAAVNSVLLLLILFNTMIRFKDYKEHLKPIFLILLNAPIVCTYLEIL